MHQVGAANPQFVRSAIDEVENARVFKEAAEDRADRDVLGETWNAGANCSNTSNDELNLHTML